MSGVAQRSRILSQCSYDIGAEPNEPNERYFYIHDRLGSVRLVINDAADVNNSYTYDPFGNLFTTETAETTENPFRFTGQWYDSEIGQYYLRARMYDPQLMRFTSRDPVKGKFQQPMSLRTYLYCMNDSINKIDPSGGFASWVASDLIAGAAVHSAAIYITGEGVYGDPRLMDIGMATENLVAPAVFLGTGQVAVLKRFLH